MAVKHQDKKALQIWSKEIAACGTGGTPGINSILVLVWFGLVWFTDLVQGDCSLWDRRNSRCKLNLCLVWFGQV